MPKVSIILPVYNVEPYLDECMDSVLNQTFSDIEVILVDDGSPDRCPEMCDEYVKRDSRVRVHHQKNAGVSVARNIGIQMASSDWIMFVDPDDWLELDAVEFLYKKAVESHSDLICAGAWRFTEKKEFIPGSGNIKHEMLVKQSDNRELIMAMLGMPLEKLSPYFSKEYMPLNKNVSMFVPWAKLFLKSMICENNIVFPEDLRPDEDAVFDLYAVSCANQICLVGYPVYHHRIWDGSVMQRFSTKWLSNSVCYLEHLEQFLQNIGEETFSIAHSRGVMSRIFSITSYYARHIHSLADFRAHTLDVKHFVQMEPCKQIIERVEPNILTSKQKITWWLLKHHMYGATVLLYYLKKSLNS